VARDAPALVCAKGLLPVRAAARDDAEQVTQLLEGEPVTVTGHRAGWTQITTAYGYPGWVATAGLAPGPANGWPPHRDGDVLDEARRYLGAPYEWGGMTNLGIDCSGLVHMAYRQLGRLVPRDADQQEDAALEVPSGEIEPGDLITYGDAEATHVAFWLGAGRILHASGRAGRVVEEDEPPDLRAVRRKIVRF
jgi:cell wall-associated NlpC family hydrolase